MAKVNFLKEVEKAGVKVSFSLLMRLITTKNLGLVWATKVVPYLPERKGVVIG